MKVNDLAVVNDLSVESTSQSVEGGTYYCYYEKPKKEYCYYEKPKKEYCYYEKPKKEYCYYEKPKKYC